MDTNSRKQTDSQSESGDEEMTKYAVECGCPHGNPPPEKEMTKLADGSQECPKCGRKYKST